MIFCNRNCFGCSNGQCKVLSESFNGYHFEHDVSKCKFYKTKEEQEEALAKCNNRLIKLGYTFNYQEGRMTL